MTENENRRTDICVDQDPLKKINSRENSIFFQHQSLFRRVTPKCVILVRDRLSLKYFIVELQCEKKKLKFLFAEVTNICLAEA